jgi:hypothetical protein
MKYIFTLPLIVFAVMSCHELDNPLDVIDSRKVIILTPVDAHLNEGLELSTLIADSASFRLIRINLGPSTDEAQSIAITTTAGVLTLPGQTPSSSSTKTLSITPVDREAFVQLNALDETSNEVLVAASVGTISGVTSLRFDHSYAVDFLLSPQTTSVAVDDTVKLSVALMGPRIVSEGQYIKVEVSSAENIRTNFPQLVKVRNQAASFTIANVDQTAGTLTVTVSVPISAGEFTTKTATINYQ